MAEVRAKVKDLQVLCSCLCPVMLAPEAMKEQTE